MTFVPQTILKMVFLGQTTMWETRDILHECSEWLLDDCH